MDKAFLDLLQRKDFSFITVKEICEKAGVNRSTFYLHYETVGDLLEESLEYMQKKFLASFKGSLSVIPKIESCSYEELMWIKPEYLKPYLQFIKENRQLYRAATEHPAYLVLTLHISVCSNTFLTLLWSGLVSLWTRGIILWRFI